MQKLILTLFITLFCYLATAQQQNDSIMIPIDSTSSLENRKFDEELSQKYNGDEFDYVTNNGASQNLITRFLKWFLEKLSDTFGFNINPALYKIFEWLIYVLMAVLVIYFLVKFFIAENFSTLFTKKATSINDINLSEEHIENIDLDSLIEAALHAKDYRLAIRYQFLKMLKQLSQNNIIEWHYEKTNSEYQQEITSQKIKPLFSEASYIYDYIWYGEQDIDENTYSAVQLRFAALKNNITN